MNGLEYDLNTSITVIDDKLIITLAGEMTDSQIVMINESVTAKAYATSIHGTILNFSMVPVLDTYTFTAFERISKSLMLMGIKVVWVGLRPGTVSALMDLEAKIELRGIFLAVSLDQGLKILAENIVPK